MRAVFKPKLLLILLCLLLMATGSANAQSVFPKSSLVTQRCSACHKPVEQGQLEVIEHTRKTPEEWKVVIERMIRLNSAPIEDAAFYPIVKDLSRYLCLSPAEMSKIAYLNSDENSQYREMPANDLETRIYTACVRCHTYGKIASHRMTKEQWGDIRNLHLGYYPTTVPQMREMDWMKESEELIEPLSKMFPFDDPDWKKWMDNRKHVDLSGDWVVAGYQPGIGYYKGIYTIKENAEKGEDEYFIEKTVVYESGAVLKQSGEGTLFSEYHLRYAMAPTPLTGRIEGVFDLNAEKMAFSGKWWTVVQDSNAYGNESFCKVGDAVKITAVYPRAMKADGSMEQKLTIVGPNVSKDIKTGDIAFSDAGVKVVKIVDTTPCSAVCSVTVTGDSLRTVTVKVKGADYENDLIVYNKVDGIRILPKLGRARVSCGAAYPPQGVQFVARAVSFGADGKADTADDVLLEPVDADWRLEEEVTRENDDDLKYLKTSIANGLYMPVTTYGPIEERVLRREGVGLIAVAASAAIDGNEYADKARLAVTVPDFIVHIK